MTETAAALAAPELKDQAEASMWQFAHEWHQGLALEHQGIALGDALTYDLLRIQGAQWKQYLDGQVRHG